MTTIRRELLGVLIAGLLSSVCACGGSSSATHGVGNGPGLSDAGLSDASVDGCVPQPCACPDGSPGATSCAPGTNGSACVCGDASVAPDAAPDGGGADGASDGGGPDGGGADGAPDGGACVLTPQISGACNSLTQMGGAVITQCVPGGTAPPALGGTIVDGVYLRTSQAIYEASPCDAPTSSQITFLICGGSWQRIVDYAENGVNMETVESGELTPSGTSFTFTITCGTTMTSTVVSYTATPTTLTIEYSDGAVGSTETYSRQ